MRKMCGQNCGCCGGHYSTRTSNDERSPATVWINCGLGRENSVALLLKRGSDKALRNRSGESALDIAAKRKFTNVITLLE